MSDMVDRRKDPDGQQPPVDDTRPVDLIARARTRIVHAQLGASRPPPHDAKTTVDGRLLRQLILDYRPSAGWRVLHIRGAVVAGKLDLSGCRLHTPLNIEGCDFEEEPTFEQAELPWLRMLSCRLPGLHAPHLTSHGDLTITLTRLKGPLDLGLATITGDVRVSDTTVVMPGTSPALTLAGAAVGGDLRITTMTTGTQVELRQARITGDVELRKVNVDSQHRNALSAGGLSVGGSMLLREGTVLTGGTRMPGARITGGFVCAGATLATAGSDRPWRQSAIDLRGASVGESMTFERGFMLLGPTRLENCRVGGNLVLTRGILSYSRHQLHCLNADEATVGGSVRVGDGVEARGLLSLRGAEVGGDLQLDAVTLQSARALPPHPRTHGVGEVGEVVDADPEPGCPLPDDEPEGEYCLQVSDTTVSGGLRLTGVEATGQVRLVNVEVRGDVDVEGGAVRNPYGPALDASGARISGSVRLHGGFGADGRVGVYGAAVAGDLVARGVQLAPGPADPWSFDGEQAQVTGTLTWRRVDLGGGAVSWRNATVGRLDDDTGSWPEPGKLFLDGFDFTRLSPDAPTSPRARLRFVRLQEAYSAQPFTCVADYYRRVGRSNDATKVLIAQQADRRRLATFPWWSRVLRRLLQVTIGFGYKSHRALVGLVAVALLTTGVVWWGTLSADYPWEPVTGGDAFLAVEAADPAATTADVCRDDYPCLNVVFAAVENVAPFVDLQQSAFWLPDASQPYGRFLQWWLRTSAIVGWLAATFFVAGLSGVVKRV